MDNPNKHKRKPRKILPVILSGGIGSRLWPLSRNSFPKQYLNLENDNEFSLLQNTYLRLKGLENLDYPLIICNEEQRFIVAEQMREINVSPKSILLEPFGRNTAPAIALSALLTLNNNEDPILLILSSDHRIKNNFKFQQAIKESLVYAENGEIIAFGVIPNRAETGYGYIEASEDISEIETTSKIKRFIEKPSQEVAEKLIKNKKNTWNSGIFIFKASVILEELKKYDPELISVCSRALEQKSMDLEFCRIDRTVFKTCPNISIDFAVMEKTNLGRVISLKAGWSDIGSWNSLWKNSNKDKDGNSVKGKTLIRDSKDCYLRSENRLIVGLGIKDLIIVETNDAILVANKKLDQQIKGITKELDKNNFTEGKSATKVFRPWGNYISIEKGRNWQVKKIEIKPSASISLQLHHHRAEHWVVVSGTAKVEIDEKITFLGSNESIYVPLVAKHRLSNPGKLALILIEIQSGNYLGEDDIIRFNDIYGRID